MSSVSRSFLYLRILGIASVSRSFLLGYCESLQYPDPSSVYGSRRVFSLRLWQAPTGTTGIADSPLALPSDGLSPEHGRQICQFGFQSRGLCLKYANNIPSGFGSNDPRRRNRLRLTFIDLKSALRWSPFFTKKILRTG